MLGLLGLLSFYYISQRKYSTVERKRIAPHYSLERVNDLFFLKLEPKFVSTVPNVPCQPYAAFNMIIDKRKLMFFGRCKP